jgi:ketosteroid isomerase-like protein
MECRMTDNDDRLGALDADMRRFGEAWASGDTATLDTLLSPTYTHGDAAGGFHDRSHWLEYARRRAGRTTRISFRDVRIRVIGDVAIITGVNDVSGGGATSPTDQKDRSLLFTQVRVWRDGRWLREAFHATPPKGEPRNAHRA